MPQKTIQFEELLQKIREEFIFELPNRCAQIEQHLFRLNKQPTDTETFNALFREVHSVKGSGGTHGLPIITTICHQLENQITQANNDRRFDDAFLKSCFALCDLIKQASEIYTTKKNDISSIEQQLEQLKKQSLRNKKSILVIESSKVMAALYQQAIKQEGLILNVMEDGLQALSRLVHEKFDLIVLGGEIKSLNARAIIAALRENKAINSKTDIILISSNADGQFPYMNKLHFIHKDQKIISNLQSGINAILNPI